MKESLQHVLPEGKLPGPKKIQNFLKMDDFYIWDLMKKRKENPHCKAILERNHNRLAYSTPETPDEVDESKFKEIESLLNKSKIWYHIDNSKNVWYKMNEEKGDNKEVMIIDTPGGSAKPLSAYSRIAKNIGVINQLRIYVNPEDRKKTMEIIS